MDSEKLDDTIYINDEAYKQIGLVGISVNELCINHTLSSSDGERYEELIGEAKFSTCDSLEIFSRDGSRSIRQNKIKLSISKSNECIKESSIINLKDYLGDVEGLEDYGLNECTHTGFSHLTYLENIYKHDEKISCTLILADDVYEILLEKIKSESIAKVILGINYFNIFCKVKNTGSKYFDENDYYGESIYMLCKENKVELFVSTFGVIETFIVETHKNTLITKTDDKTYGNNQLTEYQQDVLKEITEVRSVIFYGFLVTTIVLIIIAFCT